MASSSSCLASSCLASPSSSSALLSVRRCPFILTIPDCLRLPPLAPLAPPGTRLQRYHVGQIRFLIHLGGDGIADSLLLPQQTITLPGADPAAAIPRQSLPLTYTFSRREGVLRRRPFFLCPQPQCRRRTPRLYLAAVRLGLQGQLEIVEQGQRLRQEQAGDRHFACRQCSGLSVPPQPGPRPSRRLQKWLYSLDPAAPIPSGISQREILATLPCWLRWLQEGKGRRRDWKGAVIG